MIAVAAIGKNIKIFALWGQKLMAEIHDATKDCINNDPIVTARSPVVQTTTIHC